MRKHIWNRILRSIEQLYHSNRCLSTINTNVLPNTNSSHLSNEIIFKTNEKDEGSHRESSSSSSNWFKLIIGSSALIWAVSKSNKQDDQRFHWLPKVDAFSLGGGDGGNDDDGNKKVGKFKYKYQNMNFIADIVEHVSKSVVYIEVIKQSNFLGQSRASGSGFLVDKQRGIVLTNAHVVDSANQVILRFNDSRQISGLVEFIDDRTDLATIRVDPAKVQDIDEIVLGDSKLCRAGEFVIAVGAPFSLSNTVTVGVISSISRAGKELGIRDNIDYIQTDASINVGNSGGPLINLDGEAIGINSMKVGEGVSFAIPSFYVNEFLLKTSRLRDQWEKQHKQTHRNYIDSRYGYEQNSPVPKRKRYLGLTMITLNDQILDSLRAHQSAQIPPNIRSGVLVARIVLGSPAHLAGLEVGDIVLQINGKPIQTVDDVFLVMENSDQLNLVVSRRGELVRLAITPLQVQ